MKALDLAGIGMDCLAAVTAGLYTSAKFADQIRKTDDEKRSMRSGAAVAPTAWSPGARNDDDVEPDAKEILWAWENSRFKDRYTDMLMGWGEWIWDKLDFLGWAGIPLFIPAALVLFLLATPWVLLRLPFLIVTFVLDRDNDFRLRIIVLSFGLGLCLQFASAAVG
jgi:hypothetical protein